jgi:hypothetical protein
MSAYILLDTHKQVRKEWMDSNAIHPVTGVGDIPREKKRRKLEYYRADEGNNSFAFYFMWV